MKTILNTDRLNRLPARIPPRWADDLSPAPAPRADVGTAQPAESLPRNSARCPALSELAVWRPNWRLHNKERARYENPLISADSPLTPRRSHSRYEQLFNRRYGRSSHLWRNRFFSCLLGREHLLTALFCADDNPLRVGLVGQAEHYPSSSARAHAEEKDGSGLLDWALWPIRCFGRQVVRNAARPIRQLREP